MLKEKRKKTEYIIYMVNQAILQKIVILIT